jgi:hypothetical protein
LGKEKDKSMKPICDINPEHGEMQEEPMYGVGMVVEQYGWFCRVPDCDGYGGPVKTASKKQKVSDQKQLSLFE